MEKATPVFNPRPSGARTTALLAAVAVAALVAVTFVVARTTARAEFAARVRPAVPFARAAARAALPLAGRQAAECGYSTCLNSKFSGQCDGCVECMRSCEYPYAMRCYRTYAMACTGR